MQIVVRSRKPTSMPSSARERLLDDLLLHLAVQRHERLVALAVLAQADHRILLGELHERRVHRCRLTDVVRDHRDLEHRRREDLRRPAGRRTDGVAGAYRAKAGELGDLTRAHHRPIDCGTVLEHLQPSDRRVAAVLEVEPFSDPHRAVEHPHVCDLLARRGALHLEDQA